MTLGLITDAERSQFVPEDYKYAKAAAASYCHTIYNIGGWV